MRRYPPTRIVAAVLMLAAACPTVAAAWGPPRSNGLGTGELRGRSGADYLRGAEGPDTVRGNGGADLLTGDSGPDRVYGASGSDTMTGGAGEDRLIGGSGNDIVFGGFGADLIEGGPGDDALDGNNDDDALDGGEGNDVLHGGSGIDEIVGGPGDDRIFGDSGADRIRAGDGDDTVVVDGARTATVSCGPGNDTLYIAVVAEAITDYAGRGAQTRYGNDCETIWATDALSDPNKGVTYLAPDRGGKYVGTQRDDTLLGGPGADALVGGSGNDVLWGLRQPDVTSSATDVLDAGPGDDTVYGGPGRQAILGGPGDDFLEGGIGNGSISAGTGDDTIRLRGGGLTKVDAGPGSDTIYARGTARAQIRCGSGRDVAHVDAGDRVWSDCERIVGSSARRRAVAKPYPEEIGSTVGLVRWWRLGEQPSPLGFGGTVYDRVTGAYGSVSGRLGEPGTTDDGDTAFASDVPYYAGEAALQLSMPNTLLHGAFTFEAWFRADDATTGRGLLSDVYGSSVPAVVFVREANDVLRAVIAKSPDDPNLVAVRTPPLDLLPYSWHHVALTRADDRIAIYVDGAERAQAPATPIALVETSHTIGVGSRIGGYKGWAGAIDEIAFYDRPLDAATVQAHARAGDDAIAPVARFDPPLAALQSQSGVVHLKADKAGASFRCSLDGAAYAGCKPDHPLDSLPDGPHELRVLATSRTGATQVDPTVARFTVDGTVPGTLLVMRVAPRDDGRAIVAFASDSATTFQCRYNRGSLSSEADYKPCQAPMDARPGMTFEVRARDAAGNHDPSTAALTAPAAGLGFFGLTLPTFAGARAEARIAGEGYVDTAERQCKIDAGDWAACSPSFKLPILDPGTHRMQVRERFAPGRPYAITPPLAWTVAPRPGDVAIAGLQMQLVIERGARLLRRAPRVRFALSHAASVAIEVLHRGRKPVFQVVAGGKTGANLMKISARKLNALGEGRYTVRVTARGATGAIAVQQLPLAIVPPLR
jgi:Ca2+-binding RTX toxin-like protein